MNLTIRRAATTVALMLALALTGSPAPAAIAAPTDGNPCAVANPPAECSVPVPIPNDKVRCVSPHGDKVPCPVKKHPKKKHHHRHHKNGK